MLRYLVYLFQETVLGITSLSALGSIGAVLEIILILYPFLLANNQHYQLHVISYMHGTMFEYNTGPSCSKLTMSLVNDSLKFTSSDTQIC